MKRRSPPTDRVVATLELLAAHATERFTLTDIVTRLAMTRATCHVVLASLVEAGYVVRDPRTKTYALGPAVIALGRAAQASLPSLDLARQEMEAMSDELGEAFSVAAIINDELVVLEQVGPNPSNGVLVGSRVPFAPPIGAPFVAWGSDDEFDAWVARSERPIGASELDRWKATVAAIREQGYGVERLSPAWLELRAVVESVSDDVPDKVRDMVRALTAELGPEHYLPDDIARADRLAVGVIHSPVFDHDGRPELSIAANVFRNDVSRREIQRIARRLVQGTTAVTRAIGGTIPDAGPRTRPHSRHSA
jgi:DNA-binding IclR family transcriptional regulator